MTIKPKQSKNGSTRLLRRDTMFNKLFQSKGGDKDESEKGLFGQRKSQAAIDFGLNEGSLSGPPLEDESPVDSTPEPTLGEDGFLMPAVDQVAEKVQASPEPVVHPEADDPAFNQAMNDFMQPATQDEYFQAASPEVSTEQPAIPVFDAPAFEVSASEDDGFTAVSDTADEFSSYEPVNFDAIPLEAEAVSFDMPAEPEAPSFFEEQVPTEGGFVLQAPSSISEPTSPAPDSPTFESDLPDSAPSEVSSSVDFDSMVMSSADFTMEGPDDFSTADAVSFDAPIADDESTLSFEPVPTVDSNESAMELPSFEASVPEEAISFDLPTVEAPEMLEPILETQEPSDVMFEPTSMASLELPTVAEDFGTALSQEEQVPSEAIAPSVDEFDAFSLTPPTAAVSVPSFVDSHNDKPTMVDTSDDDDGFAFVSEEDVFSAGAVDEPVAPSFTETLSEVNGSQPVEELPVFETSFSADETSGVQFTHEEASTFQVVKDDSVDEERPEDNVLTFSPVEPEEEPVNHLDGGANAFAVTDETTSTAEPDNVLPFATAGAGVAAVASAAIASVTSDSSADKESVEPESALIGFESDEQPKPSVLAEAPAAVSPNHLPLDRFQVVSRLTVDEVRSMYLVVVDERYALMGQTENHISLIKLFEGPPSQQEIEVAGHSTSGSETLLSVRLGEWQGLVRSTRNDMFLHSASAAVHS